MNSEQAARAMSLLSVAAANLREARFAASDNYRRLAEEIEQFVAEVAAGRSTGGTAKGG